MGEVTCTKLSRIQLLAVCIQPPSLHRACPVQSNIVGRLVEGEGVHHGSLLLAFPLLLSTRTALGAQACRTRVIRDFPSTKNPSATPAHSICAGRTETRARTRAHKKYNTALSLFVHGISPQKTKLTVFVGAVSNSNGRALREFSSTQEPPFAIARGGVNTAIGRARDWPT